MTKSWAPRTESNPIRVPGLGTLTARGELVLGLLCVPLLALVLGFVASEESEVREDMRGSNAVVEDPN